MNSVRESPASDSILDLTLCLPSMRPIRRLRPTLLRNLMMFILSYLHHIVTGGDIFLWIGEYHQSLLSTISMSGGTPRSELQKWLLWCRITRSRFSLMKTICLRYWGVKISHPTYLMAPVLAVTASSPSSSLSLFLPLGSPILAVAPPSSSTT